MSESPLLLLVLVFTANFPFGAILVLLLVEVAAPTTFVRGLGLAGEGNAGGVAVAPLLLMFLLLLFEPMPAREYVSSTRFLMSAAVSGSDIQKFMHSTTLDCAALVLFIIIIVVLFTPCC